MPRKRKPATVKIGNTKKELLDYLQGILVREVGMPDDNGRTDKEFVRLTLKLAELRFEDDPKPPISITPEAIKEAAKLLKAVDDEE